MTTYKELKKNWRYAIVDKLLWLYLWPVVLFMAFLDLRVRFTNWPKRLSLADSTNVEWFINEWLLSKTDKVDEIFKPLGYKGTITPKEIIDREF